MGARRHLLELVAAGATYATALVSWVVAVTGGSGFAITYISLTLRT